MKKYIVLSMALVSIFVFGLWANEQSAESDRKANETPITTIQAESQVVLYTIYRGDYSAIGQAIGKLYALAGQKGIIPRGKAIGFVYLNNPLLADKNHWLTEIRIVINKDALQYAGTLGEMTDIKTLPPLEYAVIDKPKGTNDPSDLFVKLTRWAFENGYSELDSISEQMSANKSSSAYDQMESKLMLPIKKSLK